MDAVLVECGAEVLVDCDHFLLAELEALITPPVPVSADYSRADYSGGGGSVVNDAVADADADTAGAERAERLRCLRQRWRRRGAWGSLPTACWRVGAVGVAYPPDAALYEKEAVGEDAVAFADAAVFGGGGVLGGDYSRPGACSAATAANTSTTTSVGELLARLRIGRGGPGGGGDPSHPTLTGASRAAALERAHRSSAKKLQQIASLKDRRDAGETLVGVGVHVLSLFYPWLGKHVLFLNL